MTAAIPRAEDLLRAVQGSPDAVAAHDRNAWLDLFARDGLVNDPVGSTPHVGRAAIERFYDTFIGPNEVVFHPEHDVVCGWTVFRDLELETIMSTGVALHVPMHLRYEMTAESGDLKIERLCAHWELPTMVLQLLRCGVPGLAASMKLGPQLVGNQGLAGTAGFLRGFVRVGERAKRSVRELLAPLAVGDLDGARAHLAPGAVLELPSGERASIEQMSASCGDLDTAKFIAAGRTVTASVSRGGDHGVALCEIASGGAQIARMRLYFPEH